jgi:subtilisin family serine protease
MKRGLLALLAAMLLASCSGSSAPPPVAAHGAATSVAIAAPAPAAATAAPAIDPGPPRIAAVTLITGDVVRVSVGLPQSQLTVTPAPGRERITFVARVLTKGDHDDTTVVPSDAAPLLAAGLLDPQLFDVSELARQGFDDAQKPALPLIVTYAGQPLRTLAASARARAPRWLGSIHGEAFAADKSATAALWTTLTAGTSLRAGGPAPRTLAGGVTKVWLDARARLLLDQSAPQIGAPEVWASGLTGAGVTVAVLDTGVQADHPDLAGKVAEAVDFTGTRPDASDDVGHGTHCAGIITGSGAASHGRYRGIAPDVSLISGKVCTAGGCTTSAIIAGMEWAAPKARIVSMSLGSTYGTDGTDPLSQALNQLSAQYGTLFVCAAGNSGPGQNVSAPGAADAALTVASVSKQDVMSTFSSRGPRLGDYAVKPDIAAPGAAIVAARAKGTPVGDIDPVDDNYTRLSGTSMATPHVAGGAALVAQQHPEWKAAELKAALVGSARAIAGALPQDDGSGRIDLVRATRQKVYSPSGSVSFGVVPWPRSAAPIDKSITYRNDGDADVTLTLTATAARADGSAAPAGLFTSDASVTVPAHGSASATVSAHDAGGAVGLYEGLVTASDGSNVIATAVDVFDEPESHTLTVVNSDHSGGTPLAVDALILNIDDGSSAGFSSRRQDSAQVRLPKGEYDVNEIIHENDLSLIYALAPSVMLDQDRTVTLDGTQSKIIGAAVEGKATTLSANSGTLHTLSRRGYGSSLLTLSYMPIRVLPAVVTDHVHDFHYRDWVLAKSPTPGEDDSMYNLAWAFHGIPADTELAVRDSELATVRAHYHSQGDAYGVRDTWAQLPGNVSAYLTNWHQTLPGRRTEYFTPNLWWGDDLYFYPTSGTNQGWQLDYGWRKYEAGKHYRNPWSLAPLSPSWGATEETTAWGIHRTGSTFTVYLAPFSPAEGTHHTMSWPGTTRLVRDGVVLGTAAYSGYGVFTVPLDAGVYTIETEGTRERPWTTLGTALSASWTVHVDAASDAARHYLPALLVRPTLPVDGFDTALAGWPYVIELDVQRQPGAPAPALADLTLDVSFDDGQTWAQAPVAMSGDRGWALVFHPRTPGFVSLRTTARDAAGNSARETMTRAYRIGAAYQPPGAPAE